MIVHLFNGDMYFHTITMIKNIVEHSKLEHYFEINVSDNSLMSHYEIFSNYPKIKYSFCPKYETNILVKIILYILGYRNIQLKDESRILSAMWQFRRHDILLHWYSKTYLRKPFFRSVSWVCWGNIIKVDPRNSIPNLLRKSLVSNVYRNYKKIVCLLESDKKELISTFNCDKAKIEVLSYIPNNLDILHELQLARPSDSSQICKVLLGNNAYGIRFYMKALPIIKMFPLEIELYALMNYGSCPKEEREAFVAEGLKLFGDYIHFVDDFIPTEKFLNWANKFDVYVCNIPTQSGLGIAYNMLGLGKKVFLTGYNLAWCRENGFIVFDISEIETNNGSLANPLDDHQKQYNLSTLELLLNVNNLSNRWDEFYSVISK